MLAASTGDLRQSKTMEILKLAYLDPFHLLSAFSALSGSFLTYICNQGESPGYSGDSGSGCCDSGVLVSATAVGPDQVVLRDMSSRNGVQEPEQRGNSAGKKQRI